MKSAYSYTKLIFSAVIPIIGLSFASQTVFAADTDSKESCQSIEGSAERLSCYDKLSVSQPETTPLQQRMKMAEESNTNLFSLTPYRPNYILPLSYNSTPRADPFEAVINPGDEIDHLEAKFQISFQFDAWKNMLDTNSTLYFAYTQVAYWQVYNKDVSSPFRETNYEPEVGIKFSPNYEILGFNTSQVRFGLVHQSNGRADPLSRSWDRLFVLLIIEKGNFMTLFRPWVRLPESDSDDDNPDIEDFLGNFEWFGFYKSDKAVYGIMLRNNLKSDNKGAVQLDWSYPITERVKWYVQYFNGYGDGLIDYNHSSNRISVGFMLTDWL